MYGSGHWKQEAHTRLLESVSLSCPYCSIIRKAARPGGTKGCPSLLQGWGGGTRKEEGRGRGLRDIIQSGLSDKYSVISVGSP